MVERLRPGLGCVLLLGDWARWYFSMYGRWAGSICTTVWGLQGRGRSASDERGGQVGVSCYFSVGFSSPTQGVEKNTSGGKHENN